MNKGILILLTLGLVFASCNKDEVREQELIDDFIAANDYNFSQTDSGIYYEITVAGNGSNPVETDQVTVHYHGELLDGTVFDSTQGGNSITFPLNGVIEGWTQSVPLLKRGGKGFFLIPSDLAYGELGSPPSIPSNAPLLFEIELIDF